MEALKELEVPSLPAALVQEQRQDKEQELGQEQAAQVPLVEACVGAAMGLQEVACLAAIQEVGLLAEVVSAQFQAMRSSIG